ncbi:hypothetical protein GCM10027275_41780 [Rhabdobacter roseus]|uniref:Ribosomal protein L44E n=1 Tax=Rhabdobacter roseus TaxID=1655419 RepID=A0A840TPC1_9BACT|nr:hypothetical protein [Rhabdobacter roseus]MBB5286156.1 ribosomal protein L44E [Rhabdobacter roseus]
MVEPYKFYFEESIYKEYSYTEENLEELYKLIYFSGKVDSYCPYCKKESIFKAYPKFPEAKDQSQFSYSKNLLGSFEKFKEEKDISHFHNSEFTISFKCERIEYSDHIIRFYIKFITEDYIKYKFFKIGQYPTLAELKDYKTQPYKKVLGNVKYSELNKGIGLASHGIGIGSFVYFRRIFEHLIFESYEANKEIMDASIEKGDFTRLSMDKKISFLKPFLPKFLFDNKDIYGILSTGIHKLEEKKCLELYPTIELGIKLILEEKLAEIKKTEMEKEYKLNRSRL